MDINLIYSLHINMLLLMDNTVLYFVIFCNTQIPTILYFLLHFKFLILVENIVT